ncbi:hypothetical protein ZWY2020_027121 [Hordeum vulgare]|nr:hypothetical protein ZWY2020_027121 [Hordeum vulgare]
MSRELERAAMAAREVPTPLSSAVLLPPAKRMKRDPSCSEPSPAGWSTLPDDLVRRIADSFLVNNDLDYYMSVRGVCPSWRAATDDPSSDTRDPRFHPRGWVVLDEDFQGDGRRVLLNTLTGRFLRKKLPVLLDYYVMGTSGGFFVLADKSPPHTAHVLNPLTCCMVRFAAPVPHMVVLSEVDSSLGLALFCDSSRRIYRAAPDSESFVAVKTKSKKPAVYDCFRKAAVGGVYAEISGLKSTILAEMIAFLPMFMRIGAPEFHGFTTKPTVLSIPSPCADEEVLTLTGSRRPHGQVFSRHSHCLPLLLRGRCTIQEVRLPNLIRCFHGSCLDQNRAEENFLFSSKEENSPLKVIDFGLSDFVKPDERLNDIVGSAYYVAPEVLHRSYGTEGDMWSIGVIAYILLCGSRSFWVRTECGIFRVVLKAEPRFDEDPWPTLSAEANDFVKRLLNKDYHKRMTTSQALSHPRIRDAQQVKIPLDMIIYKLMRAYISSSSLWKSALRQQPQLRQHIMEQHCIAVELQGRGAAEACLQGRLAVEKVQGCRHAIRLRERQGAVSIDKPDGPYMATIILVKRVVGPKTPGETCHVVIYHGSNVPYWVGQSYGIIPSFILILKLARTTPQRVVSAVIYYAKLGDKIHLTGVSTL